MYAVLKARSSFSIFTVTLDFKNVKSCSEVYTGQGNGRVGQRCYEAFSIWQSHFTGLKWGKVCRASSKSGAKGHLDISFFCSVSFSHSSIYTETKQLTN